MSRSPNSASLCASFTLLEMLVAMAVLSLLLVFIFSVASTILNVADLSHRHADSAIEAEAVLDRIGLDIDQMLNRPDIDQLYYSGNAAGGDNDKCFFYARESGFFDASVPTAAQSSVSLVGYRINTPDNPLAQPFLERLGQGLIWSNPHDNVSSGAMDPNGTTGPLTYLTFPARTNVTQNLSPDPSSTIAGQWGQSLNVVGSGPPYNNGSSPFYSPIGSQVFRFEICFQGPKGSLSLYPAYTNNVPVYGSSITNNVAVVVAIAVLDSKSRQLVPAASWSKLIAALPNVTQQSLSTNGLMSTVWNQALQQPNFPSQAGIPASVAGHIKIYQRSYLLHSSESQ